MLAYAITRKLSEDGIVVKEVMLRDIHLPSEYAKGLEGLLLKEQESERLSIELEAQVLKQNPLLIQKIIAERLSDKVQIMMVPTDGKFFFANDVLRAMPAVADTNLEK